MKIAARRLRPKPRADIRKAEIARQIAHKTPRCVALEPKMKLLFFITSLRGGGAERVAANLANHWAKSGHDVIIVTLAPIADAYPLHPAVRRLSLSAEGPSLNPVEALAANVRRVTALRETLKSETPDIAIAMMDSSNVLLALAARGLSTVCVGSVHIHPPRMPSRTVWRQLQALTYGQLAAVVALTQETAAWLLAHTTAQDVPVIQNSIAWPLPVSEPVIAPETVCRTGRRLLFAAGRLDPQKGFDVLINVFAKLAAKHRDWDLAIGGEGPERHRLQSMIASSGLEDRVFLPGWAGNPADWYRRAGVFVLSSRFEGFPNTLIEAMAHGLPVVSFDCETGPRDIIRHGVDGLLVPHGDSMALMAALDRIMLDEDMRTRLGRAALEVRDRFSMEAIARKWEDLFSRLLAARRERQPPILQVFSSH